MAGEDLALAYRFVQFALTEGWDKAVENGQTDVIKEVLTTIGYDADRVEVGEVRGYLRDQSGEITDVFKVNRTSSYKVLTAKGKENFEATKWLDTAILQLRSDKTCEVGPGTSRWFARMIAVSRSFKPITLTVEGDQLIDGLRNKSDVFYTDDQVQVEEKTVREDAGVHQICGGAVHRIKVSIQYDALVCGKCCLRVTFPSNVDTYEDLRSAMVEKLEAHK